MKNLTHSLGQFSIFQSRPQSNTTLKANIEAPPLTAVASAVGVGSLTSIGNLQLGSITIYLTCLALGIACLPGFTTGLLIGPMISLITISLNMIMQLIAPLTERNSNYLRLIRENPLNAMIIAPVLEEGIFRGLLLPVMLDAITTLFPITTTMMFWGTGITLAAAISIGVVAGLFGAIHVFNEHEGAYRQAFIATLSGIAFGILALEFGLYAAIGAHIMNNSIAVFYLLSCVGCCQPPSALTTQIDEFSSPELSIDETLMIPNF